MFGDVNYTYRYFRIYRVFVQIRPLGFITFKIQTHILFLKYLPCEVIMISMSNPPQHVSRDYTLIKNQY